MPFATVTIQPLTLQLGRVQVASGFLPILVNEAVRVVMSDAVDALRETWAGVKRSDSAGEGEPPPGDQPGPLDDSWIATTESNGASALGTVVTAQPTKLKFIRYGTGIYGPTGAPITGRHPKEALYWEGADHPYYSVRGSAPNDFIPAARDLMRQLAAMRVQELVTELQRVLNGG